MRQRRKPTPDSGVHERPTLDWSDYDGTPEALVQCGCGEKYRSHTLISLRRIARTLCPRCGSDHPRDVLLPPEVFA